jgi:HAD superfamily hydrolase (TIGR01484 family)
MKDIILFDVDGTLVESGENIKKKSDKYKLLNKLKNKYEIGVVCGGTLDKILQQLDYHEIKFDHYFTECGCVYYDKYLNNIYKKNIREHKLYDKINIIIKKALNYLSNVNYTISGHFIDLRNGIIYISLIGMNATQEERKNFKNIDKIYNYKKELLSILRNCANDLDISDNISINYGGSVGIGIYPIEYDKSQVLNTITKFKYNNIYYFGDKYDEDGNDYHIINHPDVCGYKINEISETYKIIKTLI